MTVELSKVKPDFELIVRQLLASLQESEAWKDALTSSSGTVLVDHMAGVGTMLHYSLEKAVQEQYMDTAGLDSSVIARARSLGVPPRRRVSARVSASLRSNSPNTYIIAPYSQFSVDGESFYNPEEIIIAPNVDNLATLTEGTIKQARFKGTGKSYQVFAVSSNFEANEDMLVVRVDGQPYARVRDSLWLVKQTDRIFQDSTMPDGSVNIIFPNADYGIVPQQGSDIVVLYAQSQGAGGNKASSSLEVLLTSPSLVQVTGTTLPGSGKVVGEEVIEMTGSQVYDAVLSTVPIAPQSLVISAGNMIVQDNGEGKLIGDVSPSEDSTVDYKTGALHIAFRQPTTTTSFIYADYVPISGAPSGGADAEDVEHLRYVAPRVSAARERAVRRDDWKGICLQYRPDIADAYVWGEYEEGKKVGYNAALMNHIFVCMITKSYPFPTYGLEAQDFLRYMEDLQFMNSDIRLKPAEELETHIHLTIGVFSGADIVALEGQIRAKLFAIFSVRLGSLGAQYYMSDIVNAVKASFKQVDYVLIDLFGVKNQDTGLIDLKTDLLLDLTQYATVLAENLVTRFRISIR